MRKIAILVLLVLLGSTFNPSAASQPLQPGALLANLQASTRGTLTVEYHAATGQVRFIGTEPGQAIHLPSAAGNRLAPATPEGLAREFIRTYGALFGLSAPQQELALLEVGSGENNLRYVRFQQVDQGVPVLGGELIVATGARDGIYSASGELMPASAVVHEPAIEPALAQRLALELASKAVGAPAARLEATQPELWIYDPVLLDARALPLTRLVWKVEVQSLDLLPVNELVLVDALNGKIALHFDQIGEVKSRTVYDNHNAVLGLPGAGPVRVEGGPASGINDVDKAYDYTGSTYDFYFNVHGRDSIDNAGMGLISTVRYCPDNAGCPYENAFWNGSQMVFGDGYAAADDVIAHELTHGVTEHESRLFYYMQSGAINESFSDIWGEFIDLTNGAGNDSAPVRWQMGEDLTIGAIRSMSNPPDYGDPDSTTSPNYYCGLLDGGGVHMNSGVSNKAAFLMVDGGTFNTITVTGIGITKAAKILYNVQANMLTSGGDYADLSSNINQSCTQLIGTAGITQADCDQVRNATLAVSMDQPPAGCALPEAPICPQGLARVPIFTDDLENTASGSWAAGAVSVQGNRWYYPQNTHPYGPDYDATYATSGVYNFWGDNPDVTSDSAIALVNPISLPAASEIYLRFNHAYQFEGTNYDGGVVEYSVNNGATWIDVSGLGAPTNGYNGTISAGWGNPLGGRAAFTGASHGYISSRIPLSTLAGQNLRFRFRIGTDFTSGDYGWFVDDIDVYRCSVQQDNPVPSISVISPDSAPAGSAATTLTLTGTNYISTSVVRWNGADRPTTYVSPTQLTAQIPASDLITAGTGTVTVFNPAPGGGASNGAAFTILEAGPSYKLYLSHLSN